MKTVSLLFIILFCLGSIRVPCQEIYSRDTIIKANGEIISCVIKSFEDDKIKYLLGDRFIVTTYLQRLSEVKFSDGSKQLIQPILKITEKDWEKVILTSDINKVKNLVLKGFVETSNQGTFFSNQEKLKSKSVDFIKKEASKLGAHIVLINVSNDQKGNIEMVGDEIIGTRSGSTLSGTAYGF